MARHTAGLTARWDERFPGFPRHYFPYTSLRGEYGRGHRDAHLRNAIVALLGAGRGGGTVVNPACVFGAHACALAARMPQVRVIGTDIDPRWHRLYRWVRLGRFPRNFRFARDNVFAPRLEVEPDAVVFFGACGAVSDGALDYAIRSGAGWIMGRTCCHENIGGNLAVAPRSSLLTRGFRLKNRFYGRLKRDPASAGFYFWPAYDAGAYPRSAAGRALSRSDEFGQVARESVESDICRAIIDLDRCLYLMEHEFRVEYQGSLLVAQRAG